MALVTAYFHRVTVTVAKAISGAKFELIDGMGHDIPAHFIPQLSGLFAHHFKSSY